MPSKAILAVVLESYYCCVHPPWLSLTPPSAQSHPRSCPQVPFSTLSRAETLSTPSRFPLKLSSPPFPKTILAPATCQSDPRPSFPPQPCRPMPFSTPSRAETLSTPPRFPLKLSSPPLPKGYPRPSHLILDPVARCHSRHLRVPKHYQPRRASS